MVACAQHKTGFCACQTARPYRGTVDMARRSDQNIGTLVAQITYQRRYACHDLKAAVTADQWKTEHPGFERYKPYTGRDCTPQCALRLNDHKVDDLSACGKCIREDHRLPWSSTAAQTGHNERDDSFLRRLSASPYDPIRSPSNIVHHGSASHPKARDACT